MKSSIIALAAAALSLCLAAQAADPQGRVDFDGTRDGIFLTFSPVEGGKAVFAGWFKDKPDKNKQFVVSYFPASLDWKKSSVTVTPDKDGKVNLQLKGSWDKEPQKQTWTLFDAVQVEGAELKNGNFEDSADGWRLGVNGELKASISDIAKSGGKSAKVCHNAGVYQDIMVKAGQPVTVTFWYKAAE